jgi:putative permease
MIMTPEAIRQRIIRRERRLRLSVVCAIIIGTLWVILAIPGMLSSFLLGFVITFTFKPIVNYFERKGLGRTTSVLIPFLVSGLIMGVGSSVLIPKLSEQISTLQTEIPKYATSITELTKKNSTKINKIVSQFSNINFSEEVLNWVQKNSTDLASSIPNWISTALSTLILAPFFAFFMLKDGREWSRKLLGLVPNNLFELSLNLHFQIIQQMGGFIRARFLESALVGDIVWLGLYFLNFPYALFLAILAGVTNIIPYVGPIIGAVPAIAIALANQNSTFLVALIGGIYVLAQVLDMLLVIPLVVAKIVDLHPVTVVIVIIIGGQVMGILGMIISIPVASILKLTFIEFYNHVVDFRG